MPKQKEGLSLSKHKYVAQGIACVGCGKNFIGECISDDIIKAIKLFRQHRNMLSVHSIQRKEQVPADASIGIVCIKYYDSIKE